MSDSKSFECCGGHVTAEGMYHKQNCNRVEPLDHQMYVCPFCDSHDLHERIEDAAFNEGVKAEREANLQKIINIPLRGGVLANTLSRSDVLAMLGDHHIHQAKYVDNILIDDCNICGQDLRNEIHESAIEALEKK